MQLDIEITLLSKLNLVYCCPAAELLPFSGLTGMQILPHATSSDKIKK